jgi:hypothetical protein
MPPAHACEKSTYSSKISHSPYDQPKQNKKENHPLSVPPPRLENNTMPPSLGPTNQVFIILSSTTITQTYMVYPLIPNNYYKPLNLNVDILNSPPLPQILPWISVGQTTFNMT